MEVLNAQSGSTGPDKNLGQWVGHCGNLHVRIDQQSAQIVWTMNGLAAGVTRRTDGDQKGHIRISDAAWPLLNTDSARIQIVGNDRRSPVSRSSEYATPLLLGLTLTRGRKGNEQP
jgi:hypothetical protein